jgi:hypothetical protein
MFLCKFQRVSTACLQLDLLMIAGCQQRPGNHAILAFAAYPTLFAAECDVPGS